MFHCYLGTLNAYNRSKYLAWLVQGGCFILCVVVVVVAGVERVISVPFRPGPYVELFMRRTQFSELSS